MVLLSGRKRPPKDGDGDAVGNAQAPKALSVGAIDYVRAAHVLDTLVDRQGIRGLQRVLTYFFV
jgi:hypothetical protein